MQVSHMFFSHSVTMYWNFLNKAHENFEVDSEFQEFFFIFIDYLLNQKGLAFYSLDTWILNVS